MGLSGKVENTYCIPQNNYRAATVLRSYLEFKFFKTVGALLPQLPAPGNYGTNAPHDHFKTIQFSWVSGNLFSSRQFGATGSPTASE